MENAIQNLHACLAHAAYVAFSDHHYKDRDWEKYGKWRDSLTREQLKVAVPPEDCMVDKVRKHTDYDMSVFAMFPQTWGSTALGFGGIGGQAFTTAYVIVVESNLTGEFVVYFGGRLAYLIKRPNETFIEHVHSCKMVDARYGKETYERE